MNDPISQKKKSPAVALLLGFLPTAIILGFRMVHPNISRTTIIVACVVSVLCCFVSSFMLFARGTGLAILAGVIFLILNGFIAFFTGCLALLPK
jgi:glycerol-3-phosphate acyltransferase PlsY